MAMTTAESQRTCLYDSQQLSVVMDQMAYQMAGFVREKNHKMLILGVRRRGAPLADLLAQRMTTLCGLPAPARLDLLVKRYADDLTLLHPKTLLAEDAASVNLDLSDTCVWVVDDVLYTGHSLLKVLEYLMAKQPASVRFAALVDRGVARFPVHCDVVGAHLDVAPTDIVACHVPPYEPVFQIDLVQPRRAT
jgi:pyrimidine operon attenuation protein/uracil phosphoribosyltransferase